MNLGHLRSLLQFELACEDLVAYRFRNQQYKLFHAKRIGDSLGREELSEYVFVYVSSMELNKMTKDDDLSYFRNFQMNLLSSKFFKHKSDMRWNLYLVLVIDDYESVELPVMLTQIENDPHYARKYVVTPDDAVKLFDKAWMFKNVSEEVTQFDPVQDWTQQLDPCELLGCLTQEFSNNHITRYVNGESLDSGEYGTNTSLSVPRDILVPESIDSLYIERFREHCLSPGTTVHPSKVNLLHGPNGSGKTSLMEAIELALTNQIRRYTEFGQDSLQENEKIEVYCNTSASDSQVFRNGKSTSHYKQLAKAWYGVPVGKWQKSNLNYYFHRFNYFDSEAAYRFALNESERAESRFDYSDNLSRLVFGDSVADTQKNWTRFKRGFEEQLAVISKTLTAKELEITELNDKLSASTHAFDEKHTHAKTSIIEQIRSAHLREEHLVRRQSESDSDYFERIYFLFQTSTSQAQEVVEFNFPIERLSIAAIGKEVLRNDISLTEFRQVRNKRNETIQKWQGQISEIDSSIQKTERNSLLCRQGIDSYNETLQEWSDYAQVVNNPRTVNVWRKLCDEREKLKPRVDVLQRIEIKYPTVKTLQPADLVMLSLDELDGVTRTLEHKQNERKVVEERLISAEKLAGRLSSLLANIHQLGQEIMGLDKQRTSCPLCGHNHQTHDLLAQAFDSAETVHDVGERNVAEIMNVLKLLTRDIDSLSERVTQHEANQKNVNLVTESYRDLSSQIPPRNNEKAGMSPEEFLRYVVNALSEKPELSTKLDNIQKEINALETAGFTPERILRAELFIRENSLYQEYLGKNEETSFEQYLIAKNNKLRDELTTSKNQLELLDRQKSELGNQIQKLALDDVSESISQLENRINVLVKFLERIKTLDDDFNLTENDNLYNWALNYRRAKTQLDILVRQQNLQRERLKYQAKLRESREEHRTINVQYTRCLMACDALQKLQPLKTYTDRFIHQNGEKIERFFKLLHTPREFHALLLTEEGLCMTRKSDGRTVKAYQMSSGQRASLALAVMFTMHLAAPNAPKMLILDEPVANMDDLHLMNLLDLLRDLALSGRQIFFTTANPDVANLFRRKFSFFRKGFKHFEFIRHSDENVVIRPLTYEPDVELPSYHLM